MGTAFKIDPSRFTPIDEAQPSTSPAAFPIDPTRFTPIDEVQVWATKPEPFRIDPSRFTPIETDTPKFDDHIGLLDAIDQNTGGIVSGAISNIKGMPSNLAAAGKGALGDIASMSVRAIEFANNPFKGLSQRPDDLAAYADEVNRATAQIEQEAAQQDVAAGRSEFFGKTARGVTRSLSTAAPMGMALGPFGAISGATLIQGSQSATEAIDAGVPEGERARFVAEQMMWEGLPATLMQRIGLGGLESQLGTLANPAKRGISAALKQFGVSSLQELPEGYVAALGQAVSRVASGVGKPEEIGPDGIYNLMRDVTVQTLGTTGLVSAAGYRPASQAPATPTPQPSPTTPSPTPAPQATAAQPEPQYEQTYEQEFGDVWADLAQETPQAQPTPTPSQAAEVAPQATVAPIATPSETPEQFAERIDGAGQMEEADFAYYFENQAAVDEALRQMYDQPAEVDAVDEEAQQPAEMPVVQSELERTKAELDSLERRKAEIDAKNTDDVYLDRFRGIMRPEVALEKAKREVLDDEDPEYTKQERDYTIADLEYMAFVDRAIQKATGDIKRSRFTDPVSDLYDMMGIMQPGGDMLLRLGVGRMRQHEGRATFNIESEATLRRLAQQIYKAQAESEGLDPDGLLGAYSGLTDSGKKIRADEAMEKAKYVIESIKNSLDLYASPPSTTQRAIAAPQPAESEVIPSEEKGQEAEVLAEPQAVATPEPPAPQQPESTLDSVLSMYRDTGEYTDRDFVDEVERLVAEGKAPKSLMRNIKNYRKAIEMHREFGARWDGGEDELQAIIDAIDETRAVDTNPPQAQVPVIDAGQPDISEIQSASTQSEVFAALGRLMTPREGVAFPTKEQQFVIRDAATRRIQELSGQQTVAATTPKPTQTSPTVTPEPTPEATPAPIRFKHSGKGDTAVYEASIEGRAVTISKGKDGWEVRLDGRVKDVRPTIKAARDYAKGDLRQDLVDQRNASEEEARVVANDAEVASGNVFGRDEISVGKPRSAKNFVEVLVDSPPSVLSADNYYKVDRGYLKAKIIARKRDGKAPKKSEPVWTVVIPSGYTGNLDAANARITESVVADGLTYDKAVEAAKDTVMRANPRGPAPADTGIYRDLTAAAREGKRFVEALYPRIQPVLARIHAEAKSAVDFVRRAIAKIGEHIKPYARRFLADVRAVNKEFRQNPTRGSVPTPEMPKRGKVTGEARGAGTPKLPQGMAPDAQTRQAGVVQGYKEGVLRQQQDTRAMLDIARQVLPAKEWRAIAKAAMSISRMRKGTETEKRKALDRVLSKHLTEIRRGQSLSKTQKTIKTIKQKFNKLRPEVQDAVTDIFKGFRERNITEATYDKALSVLARGTSRKDTVTPKELARAAKIIESFEGDDKPELLRNLSQQELESINDVLESLMEKNDAMNAGIVAEMERQKIANNTLAVEEVKARGPVTLKNLAFENKVFRSIGDATLNLPNIVRGIATKSGHVYKTLVSDLVEADTKTQAMLLKHSRIIQRAVAEAGITPDQIRSMSAIDNSKVEEVEVAGVKMTKGERISLLLHLSDPDTRAILMNPKSLGFKFSRAESGANRRLKITPEVAEEIENSATPEELKLARIFFDWSNGEVMNDVNEWSTRVFGYKMFRNDQHWNRRRNITDKEPAIGLQADGTQAQQEATDYFKDRTGGTSHIIVDDAFQHVASHMNAIAALIGKFEASVNARRLLGTSAFQDAVAENRRTGGKILQELNKRINEWGAISNPRPEAGMRFVRWAGRNYTASKLATNFSVIISQPFSVLSAAKVIPSKYIAKTFTATPMDVNALAEIEATPEAADLYYIVHGGGQHIVTPGSMAGATMGDIFKTAEKPFTDKMMTFVERGNDMAVFNIWRAAKAWGQDQGLSGDELMRFTAKTARDAWLQTQPSHSSVYHSGIKLRSRSSLTAYALSMFQGQTAIQFQDAIDSVRDYQELPDSQKTAAERAKVMAKFARPIILQSAMFEALKYASSEAWDWIFGKSDAKKARDKKINPALDKFIEVVKSPVSSIPGLGPILDTSIEAYKRMALGMPKIDTISNPILSSVEDVALAPEAAIKILNRLKDGKEPRLTDARALARGVDVLSGVPTGNFVEWVSALSSMLMR